MQLNLMLLIGVLIFCTLLLLREQTGGNEESGTVKTISKENWSLSEDGVLTINDNGKVVTKQMQC